MFSFPWFSKGLRLSSDGGAWACTEDKNGRLNVTAKLDFGRTRQGRGPWVVGVATRCVDAPRAGSGVGNSPVFEPGVVNRVGDVAAVLGCTAVTPNVILPATHYDPLRCGDQLVRLICTQTEVLCTGD